MKDKDVEKLYGELNDKKIGERATFGEVRDLQTLFSKKREVGNGTL